jgi:tetraacyldisaccharide 4'-kinase
LSEGQGPLCSAHFCGDEPYLLAANLPQAHVIVGRDRIKGAHLAASAGVKIILLDDGMQQRGIARDLEVIVMDISDPFGRGAFLPRGFLRETVESLARAHLIILNHVKDFTQYEEVKEQIAKYSQAPIVGTQMTTVHIWDFAGNELKTVEGKKVGIFCGIAHPEHFRRTIEQLGAHIVCEYFLPDHIPPNAAMLERFARQSQDSGADLILCTEKDWVKLTDIVPKRLPLAWLQMQTQVVEGHNHWEAFIKKARIKLQ